MHHLSTCGNKNPNLDIPNPQCIQKMGVSQGLIVTETKICMEKKSQGFTKNVE